MAMLNTQSKLLSVVSMSRWSMVDGCACSLASTAHIYLSLYTHGGTMVGECDSPPLSIKVARKNKTPRARGGHQAQKTTPRARGGVTITMAPLQLRLEPTE
eukprot:scaffold18774_cov101-Isochrysis_galbana.AAC.2